MNQILRSGGKLPTVHGIRRTVTLLAFGALLLSASGCARGSGTVFSVGDCISIQTNKDGQAVRADDCASNGALRVRALGRGGQRPDCGSGYSMAKERVAQYVQDMASDVIYCGF